MGRDDVAIRYGGDAARRAKLGIGRPSPWRIAVAPAGSSSNWCAFCRIVFCAWPVTGVVVVVTRKGSEQGDLSEAAIVRADPVLTRCTAAVADSVGIRRLDVVGSDSLMSSEWCAWDSNPSIFKDFAAGWRGGLLPFWGRVG